jgi:outer membrane protein OmpA-like peptidoglycan-associated protein
VDKADMAGAVYGSKNVLAPPPTPKAERTIVLDDVLFDFDKSNLNPRSGDPGSVSGLHGQE